MRNPFGHPHRPANPGSRKGHRITAEHQALMHAMPGHPFHVYPHSPGARGIDMSAGHHAPVPHFGRPGAQG